MTWFSSSCFATPKRELMNFPLPLLFRTSFRQLKDFDQLMIVPFSLYSTVEVKLNF